MSSAGFYKLENESLLYSPTTVESAKFYLSAERPAEHTYPVDGWHWFDSEAAAREFFGLPESDVTEQS